MATIALSPSEREKVVVGGDFAVVAGKNAGRVAILNSDGSFSSGGALTAYVNLIAADEDSIFFAFNGTPYLAGARADGSVIGPNPSFNVYAVKPLRDGKVLIGGAFTKVGPNQLAHTRNHVARLNRNSLTETGFNMFLGNAVHAISLQADRKILVGGTFTELLGSESSTTIKRIAAARLTSVGDFDPSFYTEPNDLVAAILSQPDGKVVLGGSFSRINGALRQGLARVRLDGTVESSIPTISGFINALAVQPDGKLLLGGAFTSVGGQSFAARLSRLFPDGSLDTLFNPRIGSGSVSAVVIQPDGKIIVGGNFSQVGGQTRNDLVRLNEDGTLDESFTTYTSGSGAVECLALQSDGKILLGGSFTSVAGVTRNRLARLLPDGSLDMAYVRSIGNTVYSFCLQTDNRLFIGGDFLGGFALLNEDASVDETYEILTVGGLRTVVLQPDGGVLAGGLMTFMGGQPRPYFARILNGAPATQTLEVNPQQDTLTWKLSPTSPRPAFALFQSSFDGLSWDDLGLVTEASGIWSLGGISVPTGTAFVRARGVVPHSGRSGSLLETVVPLSNLSPAPLITSQPPDMTVNVGDSASFLVTATGVDPSYQWRRNGTALKDGVTVFGSTSSALSYNDIKLWHTGRFVVTVENAFGATTSQPANLSVILPPGVISTLAGKSGTFSTSHRDGVGDVAEFGLPYGIALDSAGNTYVSDSFTHVIRKIAKEGVVTTLAGSSGSPGSTDASGSAARFRVPTGLAVDGKGNIFVADSQNHSIRRVSPDGTVTTWTGMSGNSGSIDGIGELARFNNPTGVALDSNGNLYVADRNNQLIRRIAPDRTVTTLAGMAGVNQSIDGTIDTARFRSPSAIAIDFADQIYVAEEAHAIRRVTLEGVVTTIAGLSGSFGTQDGVGSNARFRTPTGIAVDAIGNLYVADRDNSTIRRITISDQGGMVITIAGAAGFVGSANGIATATRFNRPTGVAVDRLGYLYVTDQSNGLIRKGRIEGIDFPPTSTGRVITAIQNQTVNLSESDLLATVIDPEGDQLTFVSVTSVSDNGASVTQNGNSIAYTPTADFLGADQVSFVVSDSGGVNHTVSAQFLIQVAPRMMTSPRLSPGAVGFSFIGDDEISAWTVERSESVTGPWTEVGSVPAMSRRGIGGRAGGSFYDTSPPSSGAFYRARGR